MTRMWRDSIFYMIIDKVGKPKLNVRISKHVMKYIANYKSAGVLRNDRAYHCV
jgi:hypothetical protein